jgi:putative two-component system response regulator
MLEDARNLILIVNNHADEGSGNSMEGPAVDIEGLSNFLSTSHDVISCTDFDRAVRLAEGEHPDIILLCYPSPFTPVLEKCYQLSSNPLTSEIPIIILAIADAPEDRTSAFDAGAADFIPIPFDRREVSIRVNLHLHHSRSTEFILKQNESLEDRMRERTYELESALSRLDKTAFEVILRLAKAAELRDNDTGRHILRVSRLAKLLASSLGLSESRVRNIYLAAPMHDVGKIGIPDGILLKPGPLTVAEMEHMKKHTTIGARILEGSLSREVNLAETIALTHHEKWDGSGYPFGLKGTEIPIEGRILAVADVFDALTSKRPYKAACSIEDAVSIIVAERGRHFDPDLVDTFMTEAENMISVIIQYSDETGTSNEFNLIEEFA